MALFLCYDIRGIQSFIFKIPKLKYIIGGSALIDRFDRVVVKEITEPNCKYLFSGGGKGTFECNDSDAADNLMQKIISAAHAIGLDIRFGRDEDFDKAGRDNMELYPYIPEMIEGIPCPASGLYPVSKSDAEKGFAHKIVQQRLVSKGEQGDEKMYRWFEKSLLEGKIPWHATFDTSKAEFFHNVDSKDEYGNDDQARKAGAKSLGNRNRWAVICMDGNDMGAQLRYMTNEVKPSKPEMVKWVQAMSVSLDRCTQEAAKAGIKRVVSEWAGSQKFNTSNADDSVILPIRPIVVGGDDITIICHVSYAMVFVEEAIRVFNKTSKMEMEMEQKKNGLSLWPATGGELTISAGVLYCPVSLPLHTAINYAESLLASAKSRGRKDAVDGKPTPASIDWEQVTDSVVDTPAARRQRELIFTDNDTNKLVVLTSRPFTLGEFEEIKALAEEYKKIPASTRQKVLPAMRQGFSDRLAFVAEIAKHQSGLAAHLTEKGYEIGSGKTRWVYKTINGKEEQSTPVIDALLLLEESSRMTKETV